MKIKCITDVSKHGFTLFILPTIIIDNFDNKRISIAIDILFFEIAFIFNKDK
jgi:hypothetical protein